MALCQTKYAKLCFLWIVAGFFGLSILLHLAPDVYAQGSAYKKYFAGDFKGAEKEFQTFVKTSSSASKKAQYYKMLGICQYMQGKASSARLSFISAKKIDPAIEIDPSEVLDETVIGYFKKIKVAVAKPKPRTKARPRIRSKPKARRVVRVRKKTPPPPKPLPPPIPQPDRTYLIVKVNRSNAVIFLDGDNVGKMGQKIKVDPGLRQLKIFSQGYNPIIKSIELKKDQINILNERFRRSQRIGIKDEGAITSKAKVKAKKSRRAPPEESFPDDISEMDSLNQDEDNIYRRRRKTKVIKKTVSTPPSPILYLLPLGTGQFANKNPLLGAAFLVSQASAFYFGIAKLNEAENLIIDTNNEILARDAARGNLPEDGQESDLEATRDFRDVRDQQVSYLNSSSNIGFAIFGALWIASTIEAFLSDSFKKKSSRKKRRRSDTEPYLGDSESLVEWKISPYLLPNTNRNYQSSPSVAVHLGVKF
ncbi:MAG: PEGA domain-containing protein [Oligoflexales bacterium]